MTLAAALAAALLLTGCVVVPQSREVYDARCRILTKEMVLETAVLGSFGACHGRECGVLLASMGLVTAATAVVSGSVAVVGNVVYWFERQGRCLAAPGTPEAPAAPAAPWRAAAQRTLPASSTIKAPAPPSGPLAWAKAMTSAHCASQRCTLALSTG